MKKLLLIALFPALALPAPGQTPEEKKASVAYVQKLQAKGGFLAQDKKLTMPSMRATASAVRAVKYLGGEVPDAKAARDFVEACFDKDSGGFKDDGDINGKPTVFTTSVGLMAMVELKMPPEPYVEPAVKYLAANVKSFEDIRIAAAALETVGKRPKEADAWLEQITKQRNPDGTFGKGTGIARETGGAVAAMLRLGGKLEQRDAVVKALKAGQRTDGGFGKEEAAESDLETSYRVVRAFHMLKEKPDVARMRAFVAKCRNADGGYGVAPGKESTVNATYFASIILHWLPE